MIIQMKNGERVDVGENPTPQDYQDVLDYEDKVITPKMALESAQPAPPSPMDKAADLAAFSGLHGPPEAVTSGMTAGDLGRNAASLAPTALRAGGGMVGGAAGFAIGGPVGAMAGGALGSAAGDIPGQAIEKALGTRKEYNPWRTGSEALGGAAAGLAPALGSVGKAALYGGVQSGLSSTANHIAETGELPSVGETAVAALTGAGLGGAFTYGFGKQAARELLGDDETAALAERLAREVPSIKGITRPGELPKEDLLRVPERSPFVFSTLPDVNDARAKEMADLMKVPPPVQRKTTFNRTGQVTESGKDIYQAQTPLRKRLPYKGQPKEFGGTPKTDVKAVLNDWVPEAYSKIKPSDAIERDLLRYIKYPSFRRRAQGEEGNWPIKMEFKGPSYVTGGMGKWIPKDNFGHLENKYGIPVFRDYKGISNGRSAMENQIHKDSPDVLDVFHGTTPADQQAILEWQFYPDKQQATAELGDDIGKRATKYRSVINRFTQKFGFTADETFGELIPAIAKGEDLEGVPKKFSNILKYVAADELNLDTPNALDLGSRLMRASAFEQHLGPQWEKTLAKYSGKDVPQEIKDSMVPYLNAVRGSPDRMAEKIGSTLWHTIHRAGKDMTPAELKYAREAVQDFAGDMTSAMYMSTMGFRAGPLIKNSTQPVQTAIPLMGAKWWVEGLKQRGTKRGQQLLKESGLFGEHEALKDLGTMAKEPDARAFQIGPFPGIPGLKRTSLRNAAAKSMAPFGFVEENIARAPVYLGTRAKIESAFSRGKNWDMVADLSDIDRMTPAEQRYLHDLYSQNRFDEVADQGAKMMVDNTQFMYSPAEKAQPLGIDLGSSTGKVAGAFANWPASYGAYIKRNLIDKNGPDWKRVRDLARWTAANGALLGTFAGTGALLGNKSSLKENLGWTFLGPTVWTGSPAIDLAKAGANVMKDATQGDLPFQTSRKFPGVKSKGSGREFFRAAGAFIPSPVTGLVGDISSAAKERTLGGKIGRMTGLKRGRD